MDKAKVALVRCSGYDRDEVFAAVKSGIGLLGGPEQFCAPGERLLLKPNVLAGTAPEQCVCTHPAVLEAAARVFQPIGVGLSYGDSPASGNPQYQLSLAGLSPVAESMGIALADFEEAESVPFPDPAWTKSFPLARGVLQADGLVSLSKLKTHMVTRMTGAVKNLYGCLPGQHKRRLHLLYPNAFDFSQMLVTLNLLLKPKVRLHIMDGIMGMEGNGPHNGQPVFMGVLLFSSDPVALDTVMCDLVELDPLRVPTSGPGRRLGLGTYQRDEIELVGDSLAGARRGDFKVQRGAVRDLSTQGLLSVIDNLIARRPVLDRRRCSRCGACVQACPVSPKALEWRDGSEARPPAYKYARCIRCYCCQEICPEGAISVKHTVLRL